MKRGDFSSAAAQRSIAEWDEFRSESSGRRKGRRRAEFDYVSYHGDVVAALRAERAAAAKHGERVLNSPLIDLMVKAGSTMTEIYEIKTGCDRQSLYTAIGQLITHSADAGDTIARKLIIPEGELPAGMAQCLDKIGVEVRRFRLTPAPNRTVQLL